MSRMSDEDFKELKELQEKMFNLLQQSKEECAGVVSYFSIEALDMINEALIDSIEAEMDRRRKNDKIKSIVEIMSEKQPVMKLEPKKSCKYELPCGKCDLTKNLCNYNYEVKTDGNDI